jgi:hypothetical protein
VEDGVHGFVTYRGVDWARTFEEKRARYERTLVLQGNAAYAAGLALLMAGDGRASAWLRRAAGRWRESWDAGAAADAWGRPIGAVKASLLAGDDEGAEDLARWTLGLAAVDAPSPIGRYAAVLALLALRRAADAVRVADSLRGDAAFPPDVADALAAIAAGDGAALAAALASVVRSFETRPDHLEDVPVADTALVLAALARRNGLEVALPASPVLPA